MDAYVIQVIIVQNHMNGKDTHVRGLKILGPIEYVLFGSYFTFISVLTAARANRHKLQAHEEPFPFTTLPFKMYECIR